MSNKPSENRLWPQNTSGSVQGRHKDFELIAKERGTATKSVGRTPRRRFDLLWKNAVLATSLGATLIGWVWMAQADTPAVQAADGAAGSAAPSITIQTPSRTNSLLPSQPSFPQPGTGAGTTGSTASNPTIGAQLPQPQRLFRRPVTRTRHS